MLNKQNNFLLLTAVLFFCFSTSLTAEVTLTDEPGTSEASLILSPLSFEEALITWKTIQDVNSWIRSDFRYDMKRALQLSENASEEKPEIYTPQELYQKKAGVCIDLARFAVETGRKLQPEARLCYLMIEFEPVTVDGRILRKHWLASYETDSGLYFMADSKRPGHIAGPYTKTEDFISEYSLFRNRKIESFRLLEDFRSRKKKLNSEK